MSIIKHITLQKIVAHDFRYVTRSNHVPYLCLTNIFIKENVNPSRRPHGVSTKGTIMRVLAVANVLQNS